MKLIFQKYFINKKESLRVSKYLFTGLGNTSISLIIAFYLRSNSFIYDSLIYAISTICGFVFSLFINLKFTFQSKINLKTIIKYTLCFLASLFISSILSKILEINNVLFAINQIVSMILYSVLNYLLLKLVLLKKN